MGGGARIVASLLTLGAAALASYGFATCGHDTASAPGATQPSPRGATARATGTPMPTAIDTADPRETKMLSAKLQELRKGGRETVVYVAPTEEEEKAYRSWIRDVAGRASRGDAPPDSAPPGFEIDRTSGGADVWLLAEQAQHRRGAGAVAIRVGPKPSAWIVEAPHTFFDAGTLPIAVAAFHRSGCRALVINTVHRNNPRLRGESSDGDGDEDGTQISAADVAHAAHSFFLVAHEELQAVFPRAAALQLHGFRDEILEGTSVIVSAAGTRTVVGPIVSSLRAALGARSVRVFPDDVHVLGGTTNAQARASTRSGAFFVHVELSKSFRGKLVADAGARDRFVDALLVPLTPLSPPVGVIP